MKSQGDKLNSWAVLADITKGEPIEIERVRLTSTGVAVEGRFEPPVLAALSAADQVFVAAFVRSHGSIKEMESLFGVSYPTVKNRLNRIGSALGFLDVMSGPSREDVLARLEKGSISVDEAVRIIKRE